MLKPAVRLQRDRRAASASSSTLGASTEEGRDERPSGSGSQVPKRAASGQGKLRFKSPLTKLLATQVGRGQSASLMQQVAAAAVQESGSANVSESVSAAFFRTSSSLGRKPVKCCKHMS